MNKTVYLTAESESIQYLIQKDKRLAKAISMIGDISYQTYDDSYYFLVHEIIEQMLSVKAGQKILERLVLMCGGRITPEKINSFLIDKIRQIGTSLAKATYIKSLTDAILSGTLDFNVLKKLSDKEVITELTKLKGIGEWTAHMYLIFVLDRPDVLPITDVAFLQVYKWLYKTEDCSKQSVIPKCKKWKPYSSTAARYFYRILDSGYTKEEFHLFK